MPARKIRWILCTWINHHAWTSHECVPLISRFARYCAEFICWFFILRWHWRNSWCRLTVFVYFVCGFRKKTSVERRFYGIWICGCFTGNFSIIRSGLLFSRVNTRMISTVRHILFRAIVHYLGNIHYRFGGLKWYFSICRDVVFCNLSFCNGQRWKQVLRWKWKCSERFKCSERCKCFVRLMFSGFAWNSSIVRCRYIFGGVKAWINKITTVWHILLGTIIQFCGNVSCVFGWYFLIPSNTWRFTNCKFQRKNIPGLRRVYRLIRICFIFNICFAVWQKCIFALVILFYGRCRVCCFFFLCDLFNFCY